MQAKVISTFDALPKGTVSSKWPNQVLPRFARALPLTKARFSSCRMQQACSAWECGYTFAPNYNLTKN